MQKEDLKILIIGHARHGKDTVAALLSEALDIEFESSSMHVAASIFEHWGVARYNNIKEMFEDRHKHREIWANMISAYNTPYKDRTAQEIMRKSQVYVGMRNRDEFEACKDTKLFTHVIWVDAHKRLPKESPKSMELVITDADFIVDNNGDDYELENQVHRAIGWIRQDLA